MSQATKPISTRSQRRPAVFIVRDGVLFEREDASGQTGNDGAVLNGVEEGLRALAALEAPLFVLTPQPRRLEDRGRIEDELARHGARIEANLRYWPASEGAHSGEMLAGILDGAARACALDLDTSVLICDTWADALAGSDAGCQPVMVMTGRGREQMMQPQVASTRSRVWYAADLAMAALSVGAYLEAAREVDALTGMSAQRRAKSPRTRIQPVA